MAAQETESQFSGQDVSRDSPLKEDGRDARLPLSTRGYGGAVAESLGLSSSQTWALIPALPLTLSCTWGRFLNLSDPQFPHL